MYRSGRLRADAPIAEVESRRGPAYSHADVWGAGACPPYYYYISMEVYWLRHYYPLSLIFLSVFILNKQVLPYLVLLTQLLSPAIHNSYYLLLSTSASLRMASICLAYPATSYLGHYKIPFCTFFALSLRHLPPLWCVCPFSLPWSIDTCIVDSDHGHGVLPLHPTCFLRGYSFLRIYLETLLY